MNLKPSFLFLAIWAIFLSSCDDDGALPVYDKIRINKDADFLVFGEVFGACTNDCRELYLLLDTAVYRDAGDLTELQNTNFRTTPMPFESFVYARQLQDVPNVVVEQNFSEEHLVDYIADYDTYIYGQREGLTFELKFDAIDLDAPEELKQYGRLVQSAINNLKE